MKHSFKLLSALLACTMNVHAAVTITIQEIDGDVVVSSEGAINSMVGLTPSGSLSCGAQIHPAEAKLCSSTRSLASYRGAISSASFGSGPHNSVVTQSGSEFAITGPDPVHGGPFIVLDQGYQLGNGIGFTLTFTGKTLEDLGIGVGQYMWTWGTAQDGVNGDSVTLNVIEPVIIEPEPPVPAAPTPVPALGVFGLMGLAGAIGAAGIAMTRRRQQ